MRVQQHLVKEVMSDLYIIVTSGSIEGVLVSVIIVLESDLDVHGVPGAPPHEGEP